jgi:hypothetical protein
LRVAVHADLGLASLVVTQSNNVSVALPAFPAGSVDTLLVTAARLDQSRSATLTLSATDRNGTSTTCDLGLVTVGRASVDSPLQVVHHLAQVASNVTISNGTRGVDRVRLLVNGHPFKVVDLHDGETRTLDVSSAMRKGSEIRSWWWRTARKAVASW